MHRMHHYRPFNFLNSNILLLLLVSLLVKSGNVYSDEEQYAWLEMGSGSASGGGISNDGGSSSNPSLAISSTGDTLVAWRDVTSGEDEYYTQIFLRRWDGQSWVEMGTGSASGGGISNTSGRTNNPTLAIGPDGAPVVAWADDTSGTYEIYVRRWDGEAWVEMGSGSASGGGISVYPGEALFPSLAIGLNGNPIIAWTHVGTDIENTRAIFVRRWDGNNWAEMGVNSASEGGISNGSEPSLAISLDGKPIVAWNGIYIRRWDGESWVEMGSGSASGGGIDNSSGASMHPSLAVGPDDIPIVAWADDSSGISETYVRYWNGEAWVELGSGSASGGGVSNSGIGSYYPSLAIGPDGNPIVAWSEYSDGQNEIFVRRWDGEAWVNMGNGSASGEDFEENPRVSMDASLAIGPDGTSIIAWQDFTSGNSEIYVRQWQPYTPPIANFQGTPTEGTAPIDVQFSNLSTGDFDKCLWKFGDAENSKVESCEGPLHTYNYPGSFTVTLTVQVPGDTDTMVKSDYITIYEPVIADFTALPTSGIAPLSAEFTNLSTGDFDQCTWDFGDNNTSESCEGPSHIYSTSGIFTVILTVGGAGGNDVMTKTEYITVYEPPIAAFSASPTSGPSPLVVSFTNLSTGDFDTCFWDFGDGNTSELCSDPPHTYDEPGSYTVSLLVQGLGGEETTSKTDYVTVYEPPTAAFSASPENGVPPLTVDFTNLSTGDFDDCLWDFGDNETADTCENAAHEYTSEGDYTVRLTVKGLGGEDTMTVEDCVIVAYYRLFLPAVLVPK